MFFVATGKKAPSNWFKPLKQNSPIIFNNENMDTAELAYENNSNNVIDHQVSSSSVSQNNIPLVLLENKEKFNAIIRRIMTCLETAPEIYAPAFNKMIQNSDKFATTEVGLITAMHTYGTLLLFFLHDF